MTETTVVDVQESGDGRFAQDVRTGSHLLHADEPLELGGHDSGPAPYAYLLAALGACTSMTLRMYAQAKHWPLTRVHVRMTHDKRRGGSGEADVPTTGFVDEVHREITLDGALDEQQRTRLLEIAERCPVHRTLTAGQLRISTALKPLTAPIETAEPRPI